MNDSNFVLDEIVEHAFDHGIALAKFARLQDPEATPARLSARWKIKIEREREKGGTGHRLESGHEERLFVWPKRGRVEIAFVWMDLKNPGDNEGDWIAVHILDDWDSKAIRPASAIDGV